MGHFIRTTLTLVILSNLAWAVCTNPAGVEGQIQYTNSEIMLCDNTAWSYLRATNTGVSCVGLGGTMRYNGTTMQVCNNTTWWNSTGSQSNGSCAGMTTGTARYNATQKWMEWCNAGTWTAMQSGTASIAYVKKTERNQATNTTTVATNSITLVAGNTLLCGYLYNNLTQSIVSVSDTVGNTYTKISGPLRANIGTWATELWYASNINGGATTITATYTANVTDKVVWCLEYTGVADVAFDKSMIASTALTSGTIGPLTTSSAKSLGFNFCGTLNPSGTKDPSWNSRSTLFGNIIQDKTFTTLGTTGVTQCNTTGGGNQMHLVILRSK